MKRRWSDQPARVSVETVAYHEAGHAVMRALWGKSPGTLSIDEEGGLCLGPPERNSGEWTLLVALAGYAVEAADPRFETPDLRWVRDTDLTQARDILDRIPWLRLTFVDPAGGACAIFEQSVEDALDRHFGRAVEMLAPYPHVIQAVAERLLLERHIDAEVVAEIIRGAA